MNKEIEAEKLKIDPVKAMQILLKHLMVLKNENAFLKNNAGLKFSENSLPRNDVGINNDIIGITRKDVGINNDITGIIRNYLGINNDITGISRNDIGINNDITGISRNDLGINNDIIGIPSSGDGIKNGFIDIDVESLGIKTDFNQIQDDNLGIKTVLETLSNKAMEANGVVSIYTIFEKSLLNELEQYIKNGNGKATLYNFYTDFVYAIEMVNSDAEKAKNKAVTVRLEDTHTLAQNISYEGDSLSKLRAALKGHLPRNVSIGLYRIIALELLFLYNYKKATVNQLRDFTGHSVAGYAKHLPKLMEYGFVKKQPPLNYVLTNKSLHILLELFGAPKKVN